MAEICVPFIFLYIEETNSLILVQDNSHILTSFNHRSKLFWQLDKRESRIFFSLQSANLEGHFLVIILIVFFRVNGNNIDVID